MDQTKDIPEIQRQMKQIRGEMGQDMHTLVTNALTLSDWRYHYRKYPWAFMGAAAFVAYFLVPPRVAVAAKSPPATRAHVEAVEDKAQKRGMMGIVMGMVVSAAMRGATTYATKLATQYLESGKFEFPGMKSPQAREGRRHEEPHF